MDGHRHEFFWVKEPAENLGGGIVGCQVEGCQYRLELAEGLTVADIERGQRLALRIGAMDEGET